MREWADGAHYEFPDGLPFDEWMQRGESLALRQKAAQWHIGDFLCYGHTRYGEQYAQAEAVLNLRPSTLGGYEWVASRIEPTRRREDVDWTLHRMVAKYEPAVQDELLAQAAEAGWTVGQMREALRDRGLLPRPTPVPLLTKVRGLWQKATPLERAQIRQLVLNGH